MGHKTELRYFQYLKDKSVVIVGPANYLEGECRGKEIDGFDIVVRLNQALPIPNIDDRGKKTNVLYHTLFAKHQVYKDRIYIKQEDLINKGDVSLWRNESVKWLITYEHGLWAKRLQIVKPHIEKMFWTTMSTSFYRFLKFSCGTIPNTGLCAICHMLSADIKSLHVLGFDFHATGAYYMNDDIGNFSSAREMSEQWHDTKIQIEYLYKIWQNDDRLFIDEHLEEVLLKILGDNK